MAKPKIFTLIDDKLELAHGTSAIAHGTLFSQKLDKTEYITIPKPDEDNKNKFLKSLGTSGTTTATGQVYTSWEVVDALPSQASASGKFLTTDGGTAFWETVDVSGDIATHNTSESAHADIRAFATSINNIARAALPKAGGTMSGLITGTITNADTATIAVTATNYASSGGIASAINSISAYATSIETKIGTDIYAHNTASDAHADIRAYATSIKTNLDTLSQNALMKAGGTMSGQIVTSVNASIVKTDNTGYISLAGGSASDGGAEIRLYGNTFQTGTSGYAGGFSLYARSTESGTSTTIYELRNYKNGTLYWSGPQFSARKLTVNGTTDSNVSDDVIIHVNSSYKRFRILEGESDLDSANLLLSGESYENTSTQFPPNSFSLSSTDGTSTFNLIGNNTGELTWKGSQVLTTNEYSAIGTALNIDNKLNLSHNTDTSAHADIRAFATSVQTKIGTDISAHNVSGTTHADIRAFATSIKTTADAALPKAGGTMSGAIYTSYNDALFKTTNSTSLTIGGGNNYESGGAINLYGNSYLGGTSTVSGGFEFVSRQATASGTTSASLIGSNGAILWWSGEYIRGKMLMVTGSTSETVSDDIIISANTHYKRFRITNGDITSSANLFLSGQDYTNASFPPNSFSLTSTNGTASYVLLGKNDGTLSWKGSRVLTTDDYSGIGTAINISSKLDVSHNTDTTAHAYIQNAVATAQSKANSAYTTATSAYAIATAALPKAGGTLTGKVTGTITNADTATKVGSSTVGGTAKPVYINSGNPTAFSATIGGTDTPIYLNAGTLTSTGKKFSDYVAKSGNETVGGTKTFSDGLVATNVTLTNATVNGIKFVVDSDGKLSIEY